MPHWQTDIHACEARLRDAALAGDVAALDALLADDLIFTNQLGQVLDKEKDLDLHRNGALRLDSLAFSDYRLRRLDETHVLVTLKADATGHAGGAPFATTLRFTRVWQRQDDSRHGGLHGGIWQIIANHCSAVA
jgi:ketosteroid isomerase-like protein